MKYNLASGIRVTFVLGRDDKILGPEELKKLSIGSWDLAVARAVIRKKTTIPPTKPFRALMARAYLYPLTAPKVRPLTM